MIVSKFKSDQEIKAFGLALVKLFNLQPDELGRYPTAMGHKGIEGIARCVERQYRELIHPDETIPEDDRYYAANISGEDPQWPPKPIDLTDV